MDFSKSDRQATAFGQVQKNSFSGRADASARIYLLKVCGMSLTSSQRNKLT